MGEWFVVLGEVVWLWGWSTEKAGLQELLLLNSLWFLGLARTLPF